MRTVASTIEISRPPQEVFDFMLDPARACEWRDTIDRMEWIDNGPRTGARARLVFWAEGKERIQEITLVECDRPHRYAFENRNEGYRAVSRNKIEPAGTGSRVISTVDVVGDSLWASLLLPLVRARHRVRLPQALARLKAAMEKS